jgi:hypothetical protein
MDTIEANSRGALRLGERKGKQRRCGLTEYNKNMMDCKAVGL